MYDYDESDYSDESMSSGDDEDEDEDLRYKNSLKDTKS